MNKKRIAELEADLKELNDKLKHMSVEYAQTREGSAYGVEYYEVQCRVLESMVSNLKEEIAGLKKFKN